MNQKVDYPDWLLDDDEAKGYTSYFKRFYGDLPLKAAEDKKDAFTDLFKLSEYLNHASVSIIHTHSICLRHVCVCVVECPNRRYAACPIWARSLTRPYGECPPPLSTPTTPDHSTKWSVRQ